MEDPWQNRHFPLVYTEDVDQNWTAIPDNDGMFVTTSGSRCRVEPRTHYISQCRITIREDGILREEAFGYDAIIFGNVVHQLWLSKVKADKTNVPVQVQRRRFIQEFVKKLPCSWRNVIIYGDNILGVRSLRKEHKSNTRAQIPLSHPKHIRLISLQPSVSSYAPITYTML